MAINPSNEVEEVDLDTYPYPSSEGIKDEYTKKIWDAAIAELESEEGEEGEEPEVNSDEEETEASDEEEEESSQHVETSGDEILEKFLADKTAGKVQTAIERINALKTSPIESIAELSEAVHREIQLLLPQVTEDLADSGFKHQLEGEAEVIAEVPKPPLPPEAKEPELEAAIPPVEPPRTRLGPSGGEPEPEPVYPVLDDAIRVLKASPAKVGADYRETAEMVREGAFAITSEYLEDRAAKDIQEVLEVALEEGHSRDRFIDNVVQKLEGGPLSNWHLETIFRTNALAAKSNGKKRAIEHPLVSDAFPYVSYSATHDARVRPEHLQLERLGLQGTNFYRYDDPVFQEFRPPWSYNCRCNWVGRTVDQAAKAGVTEAVKWIERAKNLAASQGGDYHQYLNEVAPATGEYVAHPPFSVSPEFKRL